MFPLMHFITFLDCVFALFLSAQIFNSYQKTKSKNLKNFLGVFLSIGIYFGLVSFPGLIINNPISVQIFYLISYLPFFLSPFFMTLVFLDIFRINIIRIKIIKSLNAILLLGLGANLILNSIYFSPAFVRQFGQFYYWSEGTPAWLQAFSGGIMGLVILFVSFNFFIEGVRAKEKIVRYRAFLISFGMVLFLTSAVSNFVFAVYLNGVFQKLIATMLGGVISLAALGVSFWGVYYKPKEKLELSKK